MYKLTLLQLAQGMHYAHYNYIARVLNIEIPTWKNLSYNERNAWREAARYAELQTSLSNAS